MSFNVKCEDCNELVFTYPFDEGEDWMTMWQKHGHMPSKATFMCPCGAQHSTGPLVGDVHKCHANDKIFQSVHESHHGA